MNDLSRHPPAPFVVGMGRSGTTLLRLMLDAHPQLAIPSETHFLPDLAGACAAGAGAEEVLALLRAHHRWDDFGLDPDELGARLRALPDLDAAAAARCFYLLYAEGQGKSRWGDKTPGYVRRMRVIQDFLPEARFIHLIRDGRDVALSLIKLEWGADTVPKAAENWQRRIGRARRQAPHLRHYLEVRFEDLVSAPEPTLREICDFCDLEFDPRMLDYHTSAQERLREKARDLDRPGRGVQPAAARVASHAMTSRPPDPSLLGGWRERMSPADRDDFERIAGDLLADLGYEVNG